MRIKTIDEIRECPNVEFGYDEGEFEFNGHDDVPSEFMNSQMLKMCGHKCRIRKFAEEWPGEFYLDVDIDGEWKSVNWLWTEDMIIYDEQLYQDIDIDAFI